MKKMINQVKQILCTVTLSILAGALYGQQWPGASDQSGSIYRTGFVGLGTTTPSSLLHLNGTQDPKQTFRIYWNNDLSKYLNIWQSTGGAVIDPIGTGLLYLGYDQGTNVLMNGNLGIGTTNPSSKLVIDGIDNYTNGIPYRIQQDTNI